ncbi:hypothetical protein Nepgr_013568 [Nepenthes gracilis]|uniref:Uncharacterized protein n=1 Tax=Nepenthes gracilis TaxID=150966 RepID=A0AAD3XNS7_NEPGR|nr:hypothetical protein Nepgr_013568 [Nepenthes gracilis]
MKDVSAHLHFSKKTTFRKPSLDQPLQLYLQPIQQPKLHNRWPEQPKPAWSSRTTSPTAQQHQMFLHVCSASTASAPLQEPQLQAAKPLAANSNSNRAA